MPNSLSPSSRSERTRAISIAAAFALLATAPIAWVLWHALAASRNVAYWDEIDQVIALLLRAHAHPTAGELLTSIFAPANEHRTVTSRLVYLASYWATGSIDFRWIGWLGNAFLLAACGALLAGVTGTARRVRLGVVLGFGLFQLESYENFLWSGSSIDHFQVIALAVGAIVALAREGRGWFAVALVAAVLATFTLAQGLIIWPVGTAILAARRPWRPLVVWNLVGSLAIAIFFVGFQLNASEPFATPSLGGALQVLRYWLTVLGAPLAFGQTTAAPLLGAWLVSLILFRTARLSEEKDAVTLPVLWFVAGATALIAIGRAEVSHGVVYSRYMVLGGLAWALIVFWLIEIWTRPERPFRWLAFSLPGLVAFNVGANLRFAGDAATWTEHRDRAALRYRQYDEDGRGPVWLHPDPRHATSILAAAAREGIYRIPPICTRREFPQAKPSGRISYFVDEFTLDERAVFLAGWAAIPHVEINPGQLHVVLDPGSGPLFYTTVQVRREDVVTAFQDEEWRWAGFKFAVRRSRLPPGNYRVGLLINTPDGPEYIMTEHKLSLIGTGAAHLASDE